MNIAFCINHKALTGLLSTLSSMVRNCSNSEKLKIWFLCAYINGKEKNNLRSLLHSEGFKGSVEFIDFDPNTIFERFASLHGDLTTYGRLLLADFIDEDRVLYLDADLIVEVDILEIENLAFSDFIIAAVGGGKFRFALGNDFYIEKAVIAPDVEYFNAGVLLINLKEWKRKSVKEKCLEIAEKHAYNLPSHDQSLLNMYCMGDFAQLPKYFNCSWQPGEKKPLDSKKIIHFIGVPKPWDPMGRFLHNGYYKWKAYNSERNVGKNFSFSESDLSRIWKIRKSYVRRIMQKSNFEVLFTKQTQKNS